MPRPTTSGLAIIVGCVALIVLGIVTGWVEVVWLGVTPLLIGLLGTLITLVVGRSTRASHEVVPQRVTAGGSSDCRINFEQTPLGMTRTSFFEHIDGRPVRVPPELIGPETVLRLPDTRRGIYAVGPLLSLSSDPLGFLVHRRELADPTRLIVHPRVWPLQQDPTSTLTDMDGRTVEEQVSGSDTFHRLREYEPGDEPRLIHWPASAHTGQLMIRQFVDTARQQITIIVDDLADSHVDEDGFDAAVEIAASIIAGATAAGAPTVLRSFRAGTATVGSSKNDTEMMDTLAGLRLAEEPGSGLVGIESDLGGSPCILVTGHGSHSRGRCSEIVDHLASITTRLTVLSVGSGPVPILPPGVTLFSGPTAPSTLASWEQSS